MRRASAATAALLLALIAPPGHADSVGGGAGVDRCASYSGNVSGGTASASICWSAGAGASNSVPGVPSPGAGHGWSGCIRVTRTATHQVCGTPASPAPLVMDPAMQAGVIDFTLSSSGGTLTAKLTLVATATAPSPGNFAGVFCFVADGSVDVCDVFGEASLTRAATATGTITSSVRGGGAVSGGSASMTQSGGGGAGYFGF